ncbi:MAG TPA: 50S ribosomal protein L10 [Acidimicrobiales bacterium]|nr:50S ribosomal protein L10 [Acidimicrobiales bacterium]
MSKVRPDKVATVDEVVARAAASSTAVVTEYRGLTVTQISALRRQLRTLGADYKVFKNTLVRRAIVGTTAEPIGAFLEGPTAIAFIDGDVTAVAKALRDFAREYPSLIVKGGVLDGKTLTLSDLSALADLPNRDVLLARLAGLLASPMRTMAGLLQALPQNFAYGLSALIDARGGPVAPSVVEPEVAETPAGVEDAAGAASDDPATPVAEVAVVVEDAAPAAEATDTTEAPATDAAVEDAAPAAEATDTTEAPAPDVADEPADH